MPVLYNKTSNKTKRRYLRSHMTYPENILWLQLRKRQLLGRKFRRQFGTGNYVLDFYCPELKPGIEVDGITHERDGGKEHDQRKDHYLKEFGIKTLRFKDEDVFHRIDDVLRDISQ